MAIVSTEVLPTTPQAAQPDAFFVPPESALDRDDVGLLLLIGEPNMRYQTAFTAQVGNRVVVGRPSHGNRNEHLVHLPSRAVSRTHAVISFQKDGVYITHLKSSNLTWKAVDSVWTPLKRGESAKLNNNDLLCFGVSPKSPTTTRVDAPFTVTVCLVPKSQAPKIRDIDWNKYEFNRQVVHRPAGMHSKRSKELDPAVMALMNTMDQLNVFSSEKGDNVATKRKRSGSPASDEREGDITVHPVDNGQTEESSKKRRLPDKGNRAYCEDVDSGLLNQLNGMSIDHSHVPSTTPLLPTPISVPSVPVPIAAIASKSGP